MVTHVFVCISVAVPDRSIPHLHTQTFMSYTGVAGQNYPPPELPRGKTGLGLIYPRGKTGLGQIYPRGKTGLGQIYPRGKTGLGYFYPLQATFTPPPPPDSHVYY